MYIVSDGVTYLAVSVKGQRMLLDIHGQLCSWPMVYRMATRQEAQAFEEAYCDAVIKKFRRAFLDIVCERDAHLQQSSYRLRMYMEGHNHDSQE